MLPFEPNIDSLMRIIRFDIYTKPPKNRTPFTWHCHSELELLYVREGELFVETTQQRYRVCGGDILILNCYEKHQGTVLVTCPLTRYECLQINLDHIPRTPDLEVDRFIKSLLHSKLLFRHHLPKELAEKTGITARFERLSQLLDTEKNLRDLALTGEVTLLLYDLMDRELYHHSLPKPDRHSEFVRTISQYIEEHYTEDLSAGLVADRFNYNRAYFCRLFQKEFGITFSHHLRHLRIYKALTTPLMEKCSWEEIAYKVGFHNYQYFYKAFREQFGYGPAQYKKRNDDHLFVNVINTSTNNKGRKT